jgi:uncharacterized membrane protein
VGNVVDPVAAGPQVAPRNATGTGTPGLAIEYGVEVRNASTVEDSFTLSVTGNSWNTTLSQTSLDTLAPGAAATVTVTVVIPTSAVGSEVDVATVVVTSDSIGQPAYCCCQPERSHPTQSDNDLLVAR